MIRILLLVVTPPILIWAFAWAFIAGIGMAFKSACREVALEIAAFKHEWNGNPRFFDFGDYDQGSDDGL